LLSITLVPALVKSHLLLYLSPDLQAVLQSHLVLLKCHLLCVTLLGASLLPSSFPHWYPGSFRNRLVHLLLNSQPSHLLGEPLHFPQTLNLFLPVLICSRCFPQPALFTSHIFSIKSEISLSPNAFFANSSLWWPPAILYFYSRNVIIGYVKDHKI
jgi:hypothetical protein